MHTRPKTPADTPPIARLVERRARHDRREALTAHKRAHASDSSSIELVAVDEDAVVGYVVAAPHGQRFGVEVVTCPTSDKETEIAQSLLEAMRQRLPETGGATVWAWRPSDRAAVANLGLERTRVLYQMERSLAGFVPAVTANGVDLRRFRPGLDEDAWLAANASAFADHPETGVIDRAELDRRMAEPWHDPQGLLLAIGENGEVVGSCWTKLHDGGIGEIYIIGVVPGHQGEGLGTVLVNEGLRDLAERQGAQTAMLFVDGLDETVVGFYRSLGFEVVFVTEAFELAAQPNR